MREFAKKFILRSGLSPKKRSFGENLFLSVCGNLRPYEFGLESAPQIFNPFHSSVNSDKRYFKIFSEAGKIVICNGQNVSTVLELNEEDWELINIFTSAQVLNLGFWDGVLVGNIFYLTNGQVFLSLVFNKTTKTYISSALTGVVPKSVTKHEGRIIMGGFSPFSGVQVTDVEDRINEEYGIDSYVFGWDNKTVVWSAPGYRILPEIFFQEKSFPGTNDEIYAEFREFLNQNSFGSYRIKSGEVTAVKPIGKNIIVFTTNGTHVLELAQIGDKTTYGLKTSYGITLKDVLCVDYSDERIVFLDVLGSIWEVSISGEFKKLDYQHLLVDDIGSPVVLNYSHNEDKEFYINTSSGTYVLIGEKLYKRPEVQVNPVYVFGGLVGRNATELQHLEEAVFETAEIATEPGSIETVTGLSLEFGGAVDCFASIGYRYSNVEDFRYTGEVRLNKEKQAFLRAAGTEFKFRFRFTKTEDLTVRQLIYRYQTSDRRAVRGVMF